jgi:hypothetical protein
MARMNQMPAMPPGPGDLPGAGSSVKLPTQSQQQGVSSKVEQPPGGFADPSPDDPAEIAAREELKRLGQDPNKPPTAGDEDPQKTLESEAATQAEFDAFRKFKESLSLPDEFHNKMISVPWGENGETRDVPISEARLGYMRHLDHTRKNQAAAEVRKTAEQHMGNMNKFLGDLSGNLRETLEDTGYGEQLLAAAEQIYQERLQQERHFYELRKKGASEETIKWLRENMDVQRKQALQLRAKTRREAIMQQQLQQRQVSQQQDADTQRLSNQLAQLRPAAFKHLGMADDPVHQRAFQQQFIAILETGGGQGRQLRDIVLDAANAAKQFVEELHLNTRQLAEEEAKRARQAAAPMAAQRLPGATPRPGTGIQPAKRQLGLNDFDAEMARLDGRTL